MKFLFFILILSFCIISCKDKESSVDIKVENPIDSTNIKGFGLLSKLPGIYNGAVVSSTYLGNFPEWIVDFRPISAAHVTGKSELDTKNDIFLGFFVCKYDNQYKMAFRNGGYFNGMLRTTYCLIDSVSETTNESLYRFSDFKNKKRVFTDVKFKGDSLIIHTYTNKYNTLAEPVTHFIWSSKIQDTTSSQNAKLNFGFPKKTMIKDLTNAFNGKTESTFYDSPQLDPFNEAAHPYLGKSTIQLNYSTFSTDSSKKTFLLLTTQPLFNGTSYDINQMKYRSRYVILNGNSTQFQFNYIHPGKYYVYAFYDKDGNQTFNSGDYISSSFFNNTNTFTLEDKGNSNFTQSLDFVIP